MSLRVLYVFWIQVSYFLSLYLIFTHYQQFLSKNILNYYFYLSIYSFINGFGFMSKKSRLTQSGKYFPIFFKKILFRSVSHFVLILEHGERNVHHFLINWKRLSFSNVIFAENHMFIYRWRYMWIYSW
jgi:hypothetical protein